MSQDLKSQIQELLEVEDYEQVLEILQDNTDPELLPFRVEALMETDQFEEAADLLRPLTVDPKAPSPAWAWMWRGFLHYELDEQEDAKEAFTLALKREPRNVKALIGRALVYRELDFDRAAGLDLDKAMMVLGEVTPETEDPEQRRLKANIHNLRADFALDEDKADVALAELRTAAALVPDDPDYALDLARLLSLQGEVEAAVEACDQAIEGDEGFIEVERDRVRVGPFEIVLPPGVRDAHVSFDFDARHRYAAEKGWTTLVSYLIEAGIELSSTGSADEGTYRTVLTLADERSCSGPALTER